MKEKYLINARIIDPKNNLDEIGGLIIDSKALIKAFEINNPKEDLSNIKVGLQKWKELRDFC